MITVEVLAKTKRTNVSKDPEATKIRTKKAFRTLSNAAKRQVISLSGVGRHSIYRVFNEGTISTRVTLAFAMVTGISPFYFTGEIEEAEACSDDLLYAFLAAKGYQQLTTATPEIVKKRGRGRPRRESIVHEEVKDAPDSLESVLEEAVETEEAEVWVAPVKESPKAQPLQHLSEMSEDEAALLLHSLFVRAKYSPNAAKVLDSIRTLLGEI